jgi:hypothetical protein
LRIYEIYKTIFPNGKFYIGQHLLPKDHFVHSRYLGSGVWFKNCLKCYGKKGVKKIQLALVPSHELANLLEMLYIGFDKKHPDCLNIAKGGSGASGFELPPSQRSKLSKAHKGRRGFKNFLTGEVIYLFPDGFIPGSNNGNFRWANNGLKNIRVDNNDGVLPGGFSWGRTSWTEEQRDKIKRSLTGRKGTPRTLSSKEKSRQTAIAKWQNPEFREKMKRHPHGPLTVPIHNKGKIQYNNGINQIYLMPGDSVPDGYSIGGLPRPNREFEVTAEFRNKVSLNNNRTVFYRVENTETNEIYFKAGTPAIGELLGITAGQAASVLCRGLNPKRGRLFNIFSSWEFFRITKEDYLQRATT